MSDLPSIADDFVEQLARGVKTVQAEHADKLAAFAVLRDPGECPEEDRDFRQRYLREFLRFTAHDMEVVLFETMAKSVSPEDRAQAARVYLYGVEQRFWKPQPDTLRLARNLCPEHAAGCERASTPKARSIARDPELRALLALLRANDAMHRKLNDPSMDGGRRINAIVTFFDAMEDAGRGDVLKAAFQSLDLKREAANGSQG